MSFSHESLQHTLHGTRSFSLASTRIVLRETKNCSSCALFRNFIWASGVEMWVSLFCDKWRCIFLEKVTILLKKSRNVIWPILICLKTNLRVSRFYPQYQCFFVFKVFHLKLIWLNTDTSTCLIIEIKFLYTNETDRRQKAKQKQKGWCEGGKWSLWNQFNGNTSHGEKFLFNY